MVILEMININEETLSKTILALDNFSAPMAEELIERYSNCYAFKINHTLYQQIYPAHHGRKTMCDLKLLDIPTTVCSVVEQCIKLNHTMVTIHMFNSEETFKRLSEYSRDIQLIGVTYLTSWHEEDLYSITRQTPTECFTRSIELMEKYNFWGMVLAPNDIIKIPSTKLKKLTPGIRTQQQHQNDQKRITTPHQAFKLGSDFIIMGRSFFTQGDYDQKRVSTI